MPVRPCESGRPPLWARQVGSKDDDSWPPMPSAKVSSFHHERPAGVAERFQRVCDPVIASSLEESAVLSSEPTRSDLADNSDGVQEEVVGVETTSGSDGGILAAGRRPSNKINRGDAVGAEPGAGEASEVVIELHPRIVERVEVPPPGHGLAGRDSCDAGAVQAQGPGAGSPGTEIESFHPRRRS
jgi:hypothetical protein